MSDVGNTVHSQEPDLARARQVALDGLVLRTTVGSVVHGLSNPGTDDRDELGVTIEPPEYLLGFQRFEQAERSDVDAFVIGAYRGMWDAGGRSTSAS